jgi:F-box/leucine-rich repeat protein 2/20
MRGGEDVINKVLPDEAVMEIMGRVGANRAACALVCHRWRRLESASRQTITLGATGHPDKYLAKIVQRYTDLRQVCVDEKLKVPMQHHHHPSLAPRQCLIRRPLDEGTTSARKRRRRSAIVLGSETEGLDLGLNSLWDTGFSDTGLQVLAEGCPRLEKLCLIWCSAISSCGLVILVQACSGLRVLDMQVGASPSHVCLPCRFLRTTFGKSCY